MTYAGKNDILNIMRFFRPNYTEENISDEIQSLAEADVNAALLHKFISLPVTDRYGLLKSAEICFYLEHSAMARELENAFGVIGQETIGKYTKKYENGMPMFFFAQGSSTPFLELLPHETWRMRGYKYITTFSTYYAKSLMTATRSQFGAVAQDSTARGHGWSTEPDEWDETYRRLEP